MPNLNAEQLNQRKEILRVMVKNQRERCPWMTLAEAVARVELELKNDPIKLRIINALAASTSK